MLKRFLVIALVVAAVAVMARSPRGVEIRRQFDDQSRVLRLLDRCRPCALTAREAHRRRHLPVRDRPGQVGHRRRCSRASPTASFSTSARATAPSARTPRRSKSWAGPASASIRFPRTWRAAPAGWKRSVVSSSAGQVVKFHTHAGLGGIADTLGKWKDEAEKSPAVELTTVTLGEVLDARQCAAVHPLPEPRHRRRRARGAARRAVRQVSIRRDGHRTQRRGTEADRPAEVSGEQAATGASTRFKQDDFYAPRD